MIISTLKIEWAINKTKTEILNRNLAAINEFLFHVEAEPFTTHKKAENLKRVAFKKIPVC